MSGRLSKSQKGRTGPMELMQAVEAARTAAQDRAYYAQIALAKEASVEYIGRNLTGPQVVVGTHKQALPFYRDKKQETTSFTAHDTAILPDGSFVRILANIRWLSDHPLNVITSTVNIDRMHEDGRDDQYTFENDSSLARAMIADVARQVAVT